MAHTDPDMTRAYQKGHARKVLRVEMLRPYRVPRCDDAVRERTADYRAAAAAQAQEIFPESFLKKNGLAMQTTEFKGNLERETRLELATPTLARRFALVSAFPGNSATFAS